MDSLTQIVLGAAVGEATLGKKIGNKAMFWGGVAGTIPDLDVISTFFISEIDSLAFHRGISHSITFAVIGAMFFGKLIHWIYGSTYHKWIAISSKFVMLLGFLVLVTQLCARVNANPVLPMIIAVIFGGIVFYFNIKSRYLSNNTSDFKNPSIQAWIWFFFLGFFTHSLLDCFTLYGTQLFSPFSDYRVAFSSISVADPLYTVPFITCLLIAATMPRLSKRRRFFNNLGLFLSSAYLIFTLINKQYVNAIFTAELDRQGIQVKKSISTPSILNNILWSTTVDADSIFYQGFYSLFDEDKKINFVPIQKNHSIIQTEQPDYVIDILQWFSKGFYAVIQLSENQYQISDLRFGSFSGKALGKDDFIFRFIVNQDNNGAFSLLSSEGGPPPGKENEVFEVLWARILGKKQ